MQGGLQVNQDGYTSIRNARLFNLLATSSTEGHSHLLSSAVNKARAFANGGSFVSVFAVLSLPVPFADPCWLVSL